MEVEKQVPNSPVHLPRRDFIRKSLLASGGAFIGMAAGPKLLVPALNTLNMPMLAASRAKCNNGVGNYQDCPPPGFPPNNDDDPEDAPGNPGNRGGGNTP
jgi:hypothetical protein